MARILGAVLNNFDPSKARASPYYYRYYYRYRYLYDGQYAPTDGFGARQPHREERPSI